MAPPRRKRPPANQAASPLNGVVPPAHARFSKGQSGNPTGRPNAGLSIKEWMNQMAGWPRSKLLAVLRDDDAPVSKITAARVWFHASTDQMNSSGTPIAGADFDRILDRMIGKPQQAVDVTSNGESVVKVISGVSMADL